MNDLKPDPNSVPVKKEIKVPRLFAKEDHIISVVKWISNDTLLAVWMNRVQNRAHLQTCTDDDCKPVSVYHLLAFIERLFIFFVCSFFLAIHSLLDIHHEQYYWLGGFLQGSICKC